MEDEKKLIVTFILLVAYLIFGVTKGFDIMDSLNVSNNVWALIFGIGALTFISLAMYGIYLCEKIRYISFERD